MGKGRTDSGPVDTRTKGVRVSTGHVAFDKHRSRFAARARGLDPALLSALRVDDVMLSCCDVVVTICRVLMDSEDPRPWQQRLESCFTEAFGDADADAVIETIDALSSDDGLNSVSTWIKRTRKVSYTAYARRLVGAAEYDRLERAMKEDAAVVALAVRRGLRALMPFAVAWEDALAVMTRDQLAAVTKLDLLGLGALHLIATLDDHLGEKIMSSLPMGTIANDEDMLPRSASDLVSVVEELRAIVSAESSKRIELANAYLVRKIEGARQALDHSVDGVSQAANSLIELIDRLLREAFDPMSVLEWVHANLPEDGSLVRGNCDQRRPTKRAEALCLVYGGGSVARPPTSDDDGIGPSLIHDVLARVIVSARDKLQGLKHADTGDEADRENLHKVMASLEGSLMLGLRLGFVGSGAARHAATA